MLPLARAGVLPRRVVAQGRAAAQRGLVTPTVRNPLMRQPATLHPSFLRTLRRTAAMGVPNFAHEQVAAPVIRVTPGPATLVEEMLAVDNDDDG